MSEFKGKAIYNPSGKAQEYSYWAANFYVGCSNGCTYCYLKKGRGAKILGGDVPTLKKCFKDEEHAFEVFKKEMSENLDELQKHGLFFSFTTDPFLQNTISLTTDAIAECNFENIPVKVLTKCIDLDHFLAISHALDFNKELVAIGFTLTGHDELEPNASTNIERIETMKVLKESGYKTFASIEPIVDFESSKRMIESALPYCDLFKIGLESGKKYDVSDARGFTEWLRDKVIIHSKIYLKESFQTLIDNTNKNFGFVERDYNMFN